ncbi:MAG: ATP-binding protein [Actinomycetota bacterium]
MTGIGLTRLMLLVVGTSPLTFTVTLPGTPASVSMARRLLREALPDCPRADDLLLAVTELTTKSVAHSASGQGGSFTVRLRTAPCWARIEVTDDGPAEGQPAVGNGRGLTIVASVTDRANAVIQPDGCRTAWCEVSWLAGADRGGIVHQVAARTGDESRCKLTKPAPGPGG